MEHLGQISQNMLTWCLQKWQAICNCENSISRQIWQATVEHVVVSGLCENGTWRDSIYSVLGLCYPFYFHQEILFFFFFPSKCAALTLYVALTQLYFEDTEHSLHFFHMHSVLGAIFTKNWSHKINTILNICKRYFSHVAFMYFLLHLLFPILLFPILKRS